MMVTVHQLFKSWFTQTAKKDCVSLKKVQRVGFRGSSDRHGIKYPNSLLCFQCYVYISV